PPSSALPRDPRGVRAHGWIEVSLHLRSPICGRYGKPSRIGHTATRRLVRCGAARLAAGRGDVVRRAGGANCRHAPHHRRRKEMGRREPVPACAELLHAVAGARGAAAGDVYRLADASLARRDRRRRAVRAAGRRRDHGAQLDLRRFRSGADRCRAVLRAQGGGAGDCTACRAPRRQPRPQERRDDGARCARLYRDIFQPCAVLAYMAQQAVDTYGWLKPGEMLDGLGMAETTPGPLIMVVQFVGFMAAYRDPGSLPPMLAGTLGGLLATWTTFVPCFLWIGLGAPFIERLRSNKPLNGALAGVTAAVVGVILNLAVWFALHTWFRETVPLQGYGFAF